jgi:hypothetical protein
MDVEIIKQDDFYMFNLRHSPINNKVNFIKNKTLNIRSKRLYASGEVKFNKGIPSYIQDYIYKQGLNLNEVAYLSYIRIIKLSLHTRRNNIRSTFTSLLNENVNESKNSRNRFYNRQSKEYILTKGYGKKLITYIEKYLIENGIKHIILVPKSKPLVPYYINLGYNLITLDIPLKNNNNYRGNNYLPENIIMYKNLSA